MNSFTVDRGHDESGVSGTGVVIEGVVFSDGRVVLKWLTDPCSIVMWDNFEDFWKINVASHPSNKTRVVFDNGEVYEQANVDYQRHFVQ